MPEPLRFTRPLTADELPQVGAAVQRVLDSVRAIEERRAAVRELDSLGVIPRAQLARIARISSTTLYAWIDEWMVKR